MGKLYDLLQSLIGKVNSSVKVEAQTLTDAQKAQARANIGAAEEGAGGSGGTTEGGSSVQPDWNQTDETAADFIKNKTHYSIETVLIEEQETVYDAAEEAYMVVADASYVSAPGETVVVVYDGTRYECVVAQVGIYAVFGNLSFADVGEDTGEPFMGMNGDGMIMVMTIDTTPRTIEVFREEIVKLPARYTTAQTVFYVKNDSYAYTDEECTIKASANDVAIAIRNGLIAFHTITSGVLASAVLCSQVVYAGTYFMLVMATNATRYTAEYTEPTT